MKGILVGDWRWRIYEHALAEGFEANGVKIFPFKTEEIFTNRFSDAVQRRIKAGPIVKNANTLLIEEVRSRKPDFIFLLRNEFIFASTIRLIKNEFPGIVFINYHNDNPFIHQKKYLKHRHYFDSLRVCDLIYVYRPSNILDISKIGGVKAKVLLPYYVHDLHDEEISVTKTIDVVFIGHFENDGRDGYINHLLNNGVNAKIFGGKWELSKVPSTAISGPIYGSDYVIQLKKSKIALAFFSQYNNDVYTRRCFEIPAANTFMLSQSSNDIRRIFKQGLDCDFFLDKSELLNKVRYYLCNTELREKMILAAKKTVSSHSNLVRAKEIIDDLSAL